MTRSSRLTAGSTAKELEQLEISNPATQNGPLPLPRFSGTIGRSHSRGQEAEISPSMPVPTEAEGRTDPRVVVVMPAYNAAKTLERTYRDLPAGLVDQIILVDDVSKDETVEIARKLGISTVVHIQNKGYGGNQKTCYLEALKAGADIIVMLHPDYQYDSTLVPELIAPIRQGQTDMMLGSRFLGGQVRAGGMPIYKIIANRFLTWCENVVLGLRLSEAHTGFRAYRRQVLETIPFLLNSDDFVFDSQVIAQAVAYGFRIGEIGVPTRYFQEASSVSFRRSVIYGLATLWTLAKFIAHRWGIAEVAQFSKPLRDIISPYYREELLLGQDDSG